MAELPGKQAQEPETALQLACMHASETKFHGGIAWSMNCVVRSGQNLTQQSFCEVGQAAIRRNVGMRKQWQVPIGSWAKLIPPMCVTRNSGVAMRAGSNCVVFSCCH